MKKLSPDELRSRLRFDYQVCQRIFSPRISGEASIISGEAYRNDTDMKLHRNRIISLSEGHLALKYRIDFHVKTLIGKDTYTDLTTIGFDLEGRNYPFDEPPSWIISKPIPYSPHFKKGEGACTGNLWEIANGRMLLAELLIHIARMLNWDTAPQGTSKTRGRNKTEDIYEGWNPEAAKYYFNKFGTAPITKNLPYPLLPTDLIHGLKVSVQESFDRLSLARPEAPAQEVVESRIPFFRPLNPQQTPQSKANDRRSLFRPLDPEKETQGRRSLFRPLNPDNEAEPKLFPGRED